MRLLLSLVIFSINLIGQSRSGDPFIWKGTKYCGNGNSQSPSNSTNTKHSAVDACCKEHDHCPHFIPKWTQKYNLFNWRPYTISACACDRKLKACLHSVNTQASRDVKRVYFEVLGVPCFEFELKTVRVCKKRTWFMACKKFQMTTEYHANLVADWWRGMLENYIQLI